MYDLENLIEMWMKDSVVDETELGREATRISKLHSTYLKILALNSVRVKKIENDYKKMRSIRARYYDGKLTEEELKEYGWEQYPYNHRLNSQKENLLEGDIILVDISAKKVYHEEIVNFCIAVLKELNNRTWQVKSAIDWHRFTQGG
jgi:hypothetical protein